LTHEPGHTSDKPGIAPCGRKMEPVYADRHRPAGNREHLRIDAPGTVKIGPEKQQMIV